MLSMIGTLRGPSRVQKIEEGFLEPEDEFALLCENLDGILSTARGLIATMMAQCQAYNEELGDYVEAVELVKDAVSSASQAASTFFEFVDAAGEESEDEEESSEEEEEDEEEEGEGESEEEAAPEEEE